MSEYALVVDPFLGSGAFGIAAIKLKRYFVGIEIDKGTLEYARLRLSSVIPFPDTSENTRGYRVQKGNRIIDDTHDS